MIDLKKTEYLYLCLPESYRNNSPVMIAMGKLIAEVKWLQAENTALQTENEELQFDRIVLGDRLEAAL